MRPGYAAEDGVALHFRRTRLERVVSSRPDGCAYRVEPAAGGVVETPLETTYLGTAHATASASESAKMDTKRARTSKTGAAKALRLSPAAAIAAA
jgi:hypothetical protein